MILGTQLGKTNIAAWASREEQRTDASVSLNTFSMDQPGPASRVIETRATAWEEAEKAKYLARFLLYYDLLLLRASNFTLFKDNKYLSFVCE